MMTTRHYRAIALLAAVTASMGVVACGKPQLEPSPEVKTSSSAVAPSSGQRQSTGITAANVTDDGAVQRDSSGDDHDVKVIRKKSP